MIKASKIMKKPVSWVKINSKTKESLNALLEGKSYLLVLEKYYVVGILTKEDFLSAMYLNSKEEFDKLGIKELMSHKLVFVDENIKLDEVSRIMKDKNLDHVIVGKSTKEKKGHLLKHIKGVITSQEILAQTEKIYEMNLNFRRHQEIQTIIIITFFTFLVFWLIYIKYF